MDCLGFLGFCCDSDLFSRNLCFGLLALLQVTLRRVGCPNCRPIRAATRGGAWASRATAGGGAWPTRAAVSGGAEQWFLFTFIGIFVQGIFPRIFPRDFYSVKSCTESSGLDRPVDGF